MPGMSNQRAFSLAERIRVKVAEHPYDVPKAKVAVTLTIGIAADQKFETIGPLLRAADEALYRAKSRGRNCVEVSWPSDADQPALCNNQSM